MSPRNRERRRPPCRPACGRGLFLAFDAQVVRKDGTIVPESISASTLTLHGKRIVVSLFRDPTEPKRVEEALQQAYDQLETVLATSMDGFMTVALDGRITECNEAYCYMLGYSRDELQTMRITDVDAIVNCR